MYSQSALVHEDKQCSTAHLGGRAVFRAGTAWKWQWCHEKQIGFGLRTLWASFFFPGRGVKSRLQCWGCMCPAPRAMTKNMGHSFTHTHSVTRRHTHALLFSLHLCLFSLPHYIFNYQVRRETHYFWKSMPMPVFFLTQHKRGTDKVHLSRFESLNTIS